MSKRSRCIRTYWYLTYLHESGKEEAGTYGLDSLLYNSLMLRHAFSISWLHKSVFTGIVGPGASGKGISCLYQVSLMYPEATRGCTGLIWWDRMVELLVRLMWFAHVPERNSCPKWCPISIGSADECCGFACLWLILLAISELGIRLDLVRN